MKSRIQFIPYLLSLIIFLWTVNLAVAQQSTSLIRSETTAAKNLKVFDELWSKINEHYFDPKFNGVDWAGIKEVYRPQAEKAENKNALLFLLKRMLGELKTSHVEVWMTVLEKQLERKIGENFDSKRDSLLIGAGFDTKYIAGQHVVSNVENGTPAKIAGMEPGWVMIAVNDVQVTNRPLTGMFQLSEGGKINYRFLNNENKEVDLTLESVIFVSKSLRVARWLEGGAIGYMKFDGFTSGVADWLKREIVKFKQARAVIIDLRDNRGGLVSETKNSLSPFFVKDVEFGTFIERGGKAKEKAVKGLGDKAFSGKVIILTNENSGSGSEIFSLVMQENNRAKIVGTRSRGAVLASREFDLPENFRLSVAFRDYISPKGTRLEGAGIKPDFEIDLTIEDIRTARDSVLERAIKIGE